MDAAVIGTPPRRNGLPVTSLWPHSPTTRSGDENRKKESALAVLAAPTTGWLRFSASPALSELATLFASPRSYAVGFTHRVGGPLPRCAAERESERDV